MRVYPVILVRFVFGGYFRIVRIANLDMVKMRMQRQTDRLAEEVR